MEQSNDTQNNSTAIIVYPLFILSVLSCSAFIEIFLIIKLTHNELKNKETIQTSHESHESSLTVTFKHFPLSRNYLDNEKININKNTNTGQNLKCVVHNIFSYNVIIIHCIDFDYLIFEQITTHLT